MRSPSPSAALGSGLAGLSDRPVAGLFLAVALYPVATDPLAPSVGDLLTHRVELVYRPLSFTVGAVGTLLSVAAVAALLAEHWRLRPPLPAHAPARGAATAARRARSGRSRTA